MAPTPARALAITASIVSRLTNGRAPSCTSTTTTPTSGREPPRELTDPVHPHHLEPGRRDPGARGEKHAPEPLTRRLAEPPLDGGDRTDFAAQADLAQKQRVGRQRAIVHARDQRRHHREVGGRLE